jgi:hypothetical protein
VGEGQGRTVEQRGVAAVGGGHTQGMAAQRTRAHHAHANSLRPFALLAWCVGRVSRQTSKEEVSVSSTVQCPPFSRPTGR